MRQRPVSPILGGVQLKRGAPAAVPARPASARPATPRWLRPLLRVPLAGKLVGANAAVVAAAAWTLFGHVGGGERGDALVLALALAAGVTVNYALVRLALRPLRELEAAADRVWHGDLGARVAPSPIADGDMARVGRTVNRLLDGLAADRERMRELAAAAVESSDAERARIARELHDSVAQTLAALTFQLAAAARDSRDPALAERLTLIRDLAGSAMEEVRTLSHSVHPRVLDDLGLAAALEWLARQTRERAPLDVRVEVDGEAARAADSTAPRTATAALYRVAQESLRNTERHADARAAQLTLVAAGDGTLRLEVEDDGAGFDVAAAEARRPGMGLSSMRERLALVGGSFAVDSAPGRGTRVKAVVPLDPSHSDPRLP
ncbi:MAG: histidine kinase [Gemmatimonadaceae bacterium]